MLTTIFAGLAWTAAHTWIFLVALLPSVLNFLSPLLESSVKLVSAIASTIWAGAQSATWSTWVLTAALATGAFFLGHHYGWQDCINWVHANFHLYGKAAAPAWWKFW